MLFRSALVQEYGVALQDWLEDKYVTGRIKQWMNYLRQGFSEAEALWPQARKIREVAPMFEFLNQATAVDQRLIDFGQQQGVAHSLN